MAADIVIVDYGMANLRSVQKAFEKVGHAAEITGDPRPRRRGRQARAARRRRVPRRHRPAARDGPGRRRSREHIDGGKPFLGICLGLQLLFTRSHEDGEHAGLDLFPGEVVRFPHVPGLKVPHMGWNPLRLTQPAPAVRRPAAGPGGLLRPLATTRSRPTRGLIATETDYPTPFASAIWHDNVFATQFHPEKSQEVGLTMLRNFATL